MMISPVPTASPGGLAGLLLGAAEATPGRVFLEDRFGNVLTYAGVEGMARRLAGGLAQEGFRRGDRLAILLQNRAEVAVAVFAASLLGGIFVVLHPKLKAKGLQKILSQAEPAFVIVDGATAAMLEGTPWRTIGVGGGAGGDLQWSDLLEAEPFSGVADIAPDDPVSLVFTSGSTGTPRGVTLSHANIRFVVAGIQQRLGYREKDVVGLFLPLAFDYGLYQVFLAAIAGAKLFIGDPDQVGPRLPAILRQAAVSILPGVPSICAALITLGRRSAPDLPALRAITNTGERLPLSYIDELRRLLPGVEVFVMYGLTECKRVSILLPSEFESRPDTVGRALDGTEVHAVDPQGRRLPPGVAGELVVRGPHVALGYWRAPEETARRFRRSGSGAPVELFTGDTGSVDAEGFIRFSARSDDWIKHRGNRISPLEIESEACEIPGVIEAAILHREGDDSLHLFLTVSDPDLGAPELVQRLSEVLESAKVPDQIHLLSEMPKSLNGKIDRKALAALIEA